MSSITMFFSYVATLFSMLCTEYLSLFWLKILGVKLSEWLSIIAIFLGPIIAILLAACIAKRKEALQRKLVIFKTLMTTRADFESRNHVNALNQIELEFNKKIIGLWKKYKDFLDDEFHKKTIAPNLWEKKRSDMLATLLYTMGSLLDYKFNKEHINNYSYIPTVHGNLEYENWSIRKGVIEILEGKKPLPTHIANLPTEDNGDSKAININVK